MKPYNHKANIQREPEIPLQLPEARCRLECNSQWIYMYVKYNAESVKRVAERWDYMTEVTYTTGCAFCTDFRTSGSVQHLTSTGAHTVCSLFKTNFPTFFGRSTIFREIRCTKMHSKTTGVRESISWHRRKQSIKEYKITLQTRELKLSQRLCWRFQPSGMLCRVDW
jgi:hypothetical protein